LAAVAGGERGQRGAVPAAERRLKGDVTMFGKSKSGGDL
jgi:hypothetical protein